MAEAALVLSIKFVQISSDTFCLSSLPAAKPLLFTPASQSAAYSAHSVRLHFPIRTLTTGHKGHQMYRRCFNQEGGVDTKALEYSQRHRVNRVDADRKNVSSFGDVCWQFILYRAAKQWFLLENNQLVKWYSLQSAADMTEFKSSLCFNGCGCRWVLFKRIANCDSNFLTLESQSFLVIFPNQQSNNHNHIKQWLASPTKRREFRECFPLLFFHHQATKVDILCAKTSAALWTPRRGRPSNRIRCGCSNRDTFPLKRSQTTCCAIFIHSVCSLYILAV